MLGGSVHIKSRFLLSKVEMGMPRVTGRVNAKMHVQLRDGRVSQAGWSLGCWAQHEPAECEPASTRRASSGVDALDSRKGRLSKTGEPSPC